MVRDIQPGQETKGVDVSADLPPSLAAGAGVVRRLRNSSGDATPDAGEDLPPPPSSCPDLGCWESKSNPGMPAEAPAVSADEIAEPGETPKPDATRKKRSRRKKTKTVALLMLGATGIGSLLGGCSHNKQPDDGSATERGAAQRVKTNWQVQAVPQPETENKGEQSDVRNQPLFAPGSLDDIKLSEYTYPGTSLPKLSTEKPLSRDEIEKLWIDGASREDFSGSVRKQHLCLMTQDDLVRTFARVITRLFEAAETGNEGKIETLRRDLRACVQEAKARGMLQAGRDGVWRKMRTMVQEGELDVGDKVLGATAAVTGLQNAYVTDRQNPGYSVK